MEDQLDSGEINLSSETPIENIEVKYDKVQSVIKTNGNNIEGNHIVEETEVVRPKPRVKRKFQASKVKRESTPMRFMDDSEESLDQNKINSNLNGTNGKSWSSSNTTSESVSRQNSFKRHQNAKKGSISELAQQEITSLINKTKKSISSAAQRGRERFRKYEQQLAKRSQSAPNKFVEELQESLAKVQQDYKVNNEEVKQIADDNTSKRKAAKLRAMRQRRSLTRELLITPKLVEILDPETFNVVQRRSVSRSGKSTIILKSISPLKTTSLKELYQNFRTHKRQYHKDYTWIKRKLRKCLCELFLIMIFCGLGGVMFRFVEGSFETFYKCGVKRVKRDFVDLLWVKSHNLREEDWKWLARSKLRVFEEELHNAHEAGMTDYSGMRSWSFLNGVVYCLTIVTTIGYGHMYPKTNTGRALSIVYALIGIPLFLIALTDFGKLFTRGIKFAWSFVRRLYYTGSCRNVRKNSGVDDIFKGAQHLYDYATFKRPSFFDSSTSHPDNESQQQTTTDTPTTPAISAFEIDDEFNLPISVALFILVAYIFCGAVMYMLIEGWTFFECFYFVFISMTTIGFGDYVPRDPWFMIGSIVYLVFGLALMSMCINVVQAKLSDTFKQASAKIGATMGLEVEEEEAGAEEEEEEETESKKEEGESEKVMDKEDGMKIDNID
ncbi:uncharacterized protein LOC126742127 isoform X1 [Anthonomus grandis grandis]|uniref:uncharacterized protein LOC126742127 isoform X1 n=1 Tax=Anthonomus grandis grandis TaxID=2921223 RepID=UPI00216592AD|nr:uncharacterized protein LOC126742127 isoform X1 [Anthonomus grandis grandis]